MPIFNQVTDAVGEKVVSKTCKTGLFRRIGMKLGLVPKEVAECRGKSLREMAEITSKKDTVTIAKSPKFIEMEKAINEEIESFTKELNKVKDKKTTLAESISNNNQEIERLTKEKQALNEELSSEYKKTDGWPDVYSRVWGLEEEVAKEEQKLRCMEMTGPKSGSGGYSPDGDHTYGATPGESISHWQWRCEFQKDKVKDLKIKLENAKATTKRIKSLSSEITEIESKMSDLDSQNFSKKLKIEICDGEIATWLHKIQGTKEAISDYAERPWLLE